MRISRMRSLPRSDAARGAGPPSGLVRILGIDPGSQVTGYGLIEAVGQKAHHVASGSIRARPHGSKS